MALLPVCAYCLGNQCFHVRSTIVFTDNSCTS